MPIDNQNKSLMQDKSDCNGKILNGQEGINNIRNETEGSLGKTRGVYDEPTSKVLTEILKSPTKNLIKRAEYFLHEEHDETYV